MELLFSKLVDQFVEGHLTRRDLVQSLAAVAAVAAAPGAASASAHGRELKAIAVNHISYQSKDYGKARDFYAENFGMRVNHDSGQQAFLTFGEHDETSLIVRQGSGPTPLIDHIAYTMRGYGPEGIDAQRFKRDNAAVRQELEDRGLKPVDDAGISWMIKDPEGFPVQVVPESMKPGDPLFENALKAILNNPRNR
jgi:catechol 2,3-dioxygenase-like lactoylglutathione lyase family enzyme